MWGILLSSSVFIVYCWILPPKTIHSITVSRNVLCNEKDLTILIKFLVFFFFLNYLCLKTRMDLFQFKSQVVLRAFLLHKTWINLTLSAWRFSCGIFSELPWSCMFYGKKKKKKYACISAKKSSNIVYMYIYFSTIVLLIFNWGPSHASNRSWISKDTRFVSQLWLFL